MNPLLIGFSATVGYLLGSISFARLVISRFGTDQALQDIEISLGRSGQVVTSDAVSATLVRHQLGRRFGCATALLDMAKVALPVLALRLAFASQPYYLVAATAGVIGHVWPVFNRFRGGRGVSPIMGGMLFIDPIGLIVTVTASTLLGRYVLRNYIVMTGGYVLLLIPWLWWQTGDGWSIGYALAINVVYWLAKRPELRQYWRLRKEGSLPPIDEIADALTGRGG